MEDFPRPEEERYEKDDTGLFNAFFDAIDE